MAHKLGKRPARKGAVTFQFGDYFDRTDLPVPPLRFGHERIGMPCGMFANDDYACCVFAGAAHEHMVWTHEGGKTVPFDSAGVLADYAAVTGFDPKDPATDAGTDMAAAAAYRRKIGVINAAGMRHKIDSYVALRPGHVDDLLVATYLTGATGVGLQLPAGAMEQFDRGEVWTVQRGHDRDGGHYVPCIGRNSQGHLLVITWGRIHAMTPEFVDRYCDEAIAYLSLEILHQKGVSPEGFDEQKLRQHLAALDGRNHG